MKTSNAVRRVKINLLLNCCFISLTFNVFGQNEIKTAPKSKFQLGYHLNQFQNDFGLGLNITTPYFIGGKIALRGSANIQWLQSVSTAYLTYNWLAYQNYKIGLLGKGVPVTDHINIYGEGGFAFILPNKEFSNEQLIVGGYGIFGFEFFANKSFCYYLELGGIGTGATAEISMNKPIYSSGFTTSVGMRITL